MPPNSKAISVSAYVCTVTYLKNHISKLHEVFYSLWPQLGLSLTTVQALIDWGKGMNLTSFVWQVTLIPYETSVPVAVKLVT